MAAVHASMHVRELWRYPVKSLAGERVQSVFVDRAGLRGDRIVRARSASGRRITARAHPGLLALRGTTDRRGAVLVDGLPWESATVAALVRAASADDVRLISDESRTRQDVLPVSLATDGALDELGVDLRRLRPNIVLADVVGLTERTWDGLSVRVGEAVLGVRQVRGRCVMTTYDPDTLVQDHSVLQRIVDEYEGRFALDCYVIEAGLVTVGDGAEVLGHWTLPRDEPMRQLGAVRPFAPVQFG
jgi:uncharacterized protein YcbX